jgi:hypothetical protein
MHIHDLPQIAIEGINSVLNQSRELIYHDQSDNESNELAFKAYDIENYSFAIRESKGGQPFHIYFIPASNESVKKKIIGCRAIEIANHFSLWVELVQNAKIAISEFNDPIFNQYYKEYYSSWTTKEEGAHRRPSAHAQLISTIIAKKVLQHKEAIMDEAPNGDAKKIIQYANEILLKLHYFSNDKLGEHIAAMLALLRKSAMFSFYAITESYIADAAKFGLPIAVQQGIQSAIQLFHAHFG